MSEQRPPRGQYPPPNTYASDSYGQNSYRQGQVNPNPPGPYQQRPGQAGPYQQGQYHQGQDPAARLDRSYRPLPADQDRYQVRVRRGSGTRTFWVILGCAVAVQMIIAFGIMTLHAVSGH